MHSPLSKSLPCHARKFYSSRDLERALRRFDSAKLMRKQGKKKPLQVFDLQGNIKVKK